MKLPQIHILLALWLTALSASVGGPLYAGPVDAQGRPLIEKLGTVALDIVETTPVVFDNKLYRYQWNRSGECFEFIDLQTGQATPSFADGWEYGSAFVENGTVYVTGTNSSRDVVKLWTSTDLTNWTATTALSLPGWSMYNTSICKADGKYVMMFEIDEPASEAGVPFTARFATSTDLQNWTLTSSDCVFAKGRYTAPHCLRYCNGCYYDFYLEHPADTYEQYVVRSTDLINWEYSLLNPVLSASADDRKIASGTSFTADELERIATATNINNSDIDFCEYEGQLVIYYSWGNQRGIEQLAQAVYQGTEAEFLLGWFGEEVPEPSSVVLVVTFMLGLSAYAWRKRK